MRKAALVRGVDFFYKPIASSSNSNIPSADNANPSEEQQPVVDGSSDQVDVQSVDQNVVEPEDGSEQGRTGSTAFEKMVGNLFSRGFNLFV